MNTLRCLNCGFDYDSTAPKCTSCGKPPPWEAEIEAIRSVIKEREVNRGRATVTLIEEAFSALRGGNPVSLAAVKGFAFAWLFPRTVIVIGSVIAGITLILQTVILARQTDLVSEQTILLARQSSAARLDQEERLRSRIGVLQELVSDLGHFRSATISAIRFYSLPAACQQLCLEDRALMVVGREAISRKLPSAPSFPPVTLLSVASAEGAADAVRSAIDAAGTISDVVSTRPSGATPAESQRSEVAALLRSAQRQCLLPADKASLVKSALSVLVAVHVGDGVLSAKGSRTVQSWIAAMSLAGVKVGNEPITFLNAGKLTVRDLHTAVFNGAGSVETVAGSAQQLCASQLASDQATLASILAESQPTAKGS